MSTYQGEATEIPDRILVGGYVHANLRASLADIAESNHLIYTYLCKLRFPTLQYTNDFSILNSQIKLVELYH